MKEKQKFNIGDTVYYLDSKIKEGKITQVTQYLTDFDFVNYNYYVDGSRFDESEIFKSQSDIIRKTIYETLNGFHLDSEKVEFICKTLFPEEYNEENGNELTDEDFEKLEKPEEPLQIEEKTSFWKGLFK
ncbi:MAG: hypothetical protein IKU98_03485 [Bacteroidaceae bacterium]|nr:hypothetical protein [Bacteroidaceae bacterium]